MENEARRLIFEHIDYYRYRSISRGNTPQYATAFSFTNMKASTHATRSDTFPRSWHTPPGTLSFFSTYTAITERAKSTSRVVALRQLL